MNSTESLLARHVSEAGLPQVRSARRLTGHGFDHEILLATLVDDRQVVLRRSRSGPRPLVTGRARFLADQDLPAPTLLGGDESATLYEYAPGEMLSTLVADGQVTDDDWRSAGTAFRRVHGVRFPSGLQGILGPDHLVLRPTDPVADLQETLAKLEPRLATVLPVVIPHLPRLHAVIDENARALRETPTSLLHRDVYPANVIVGPERTTLIDWDEPRVGDPAQEIAALEEHIYLINGGRLPDAFFDTYGPRPPNTAIHRLTGALGWFGGWTDEPGLDPALKTRVDRWLITLAAYLADLGRHLEAF